MIVLDIYKSRETDTLGLSAEAFAHEIDHPAVKHIAKREDATAFLQSNTQPGDAIIVMNAGDATEMTEWLVS